LCPNQIHKAKVQVLIIVDILSNLSIYGPGLFYNQYAKEPKHQSSKFVSEKSHPGPQGKHVQEWLIQWSAEVCLAGYIVTHNLVMILNFEA